MSQLKEMDELLRCSVCTERYNIDTRKPKILMCHHTFCLKCLKGWASKQANSKNGINISCPSCRKVTSVGKKGVSSLQDNFYLEHVQSAVNAMDGIFVSDEEEIHDKKSAQDNIRYKIWCQTCKKTASSSCSTDSDHNICNFVQGAVEHLQNLRQSVTEKLLTEINCWETVVAFFESSMSVLKSVDASGQIQEDLNSYRLALTVARSELDAMLELHTISNKDPPSLLVKKITKVENLLKLITSRLAKAKKAKAVLFIGSLNIGITSPESNVIKADSNKNDSIFLHLNEDTKYVKILKYYFYKVLLSYRDDTIDDIDDIDDSFAPPFMDDNKTSLGQEENSWHHVESRKGRSNYSDANGIQLLNLVTKPPISSNSNASNGILEPMPGTSGLHKPTIIVKELGSSGNKSRCFFDIETNGHFMGKVVIKLRHDIAPKMCANFVALCTGELGFGYKGTIIFNAHPNEHVIGGDIENNDGTGGYSIYNNKGLFIADECSLRDEMGAIRMRGMGTDIKTGNGLVGSQFHIWLGRRDFRVYRRTLVIGQVVQGLNILQDISMFKAIRKSDGNFVLTTKAIIKNCGTY